MRRLLFTLLPLLLLPIACKKPQAVAKVVSPPPDEVNPAPVAPVARRRVLDAPVWTQTLAVIDTKLQVVAPESYTENLTGQITERVEAAFVATARFDLVERARLDAVRKELMLTTDALFFDQTTVVKMGKALGARYLALPSARLEVGLFGTRLDVMVKVLDTETASVVQTFDARVASSSLSINSSVTACLDRIRVDLTDTLRPVYPAQAVIVHSPTPGIFWAEAKQMRNFKAGEKVRVLQSTDVFNPVTKTTAPFTTEAGRGRIQSVETYGIVIKVSKDLKAEEGWLVEVLP